MIYPKGELETVLLFCFVDSDGIIYVTVNIRNQ